MNEHETPAIPTVVASFARMLREALSDGLVGVYLGGSFVMGDFVGGVSDFDVLVVLATPLSAAELETIAGLHGQLVSTDAEAERLEGDYVPRRWLTAEGTSQAVPWFRRGRLQPAPAFMLSADNIANLREQGLTVFGPPAAVVLPAVTADQVRAAVRAMLNDVKSCSTEEQAADELVDLLRSMRALETGAPTTKSDGVRWGLAHLGSSSHSLIRRADAVRRGASPGEGDVLRRGLAEVRVELGVGRVGD